MLYRVCGDNLQGTNDAIRGEWRNVGTIISRRATPYIHNLLNVYWVNMFEDSQYTYQFRQYTGEVATLGRVTFYRKLSRIEEGNKTEIKRCTARCIQKAKIDTKIGNGEGVGAYSLSSAGMSMVKVSEEYSAEKYNEDDVINKLDWVRADKKRRNNLIAKNQKVADYISNLAYRKKIENKKKEQEELNSASIRTVSTVRPSVFRYTNLVLYIQQFPQKILSLAAPKEKTVYRNGQLVAR